MILWILWISGIINDDDDIIICQCYLFNVQQMQYLNGKRERHTDNITWKTYNCTHNITTAQYPLFLGHHVVTYIDWSVKPNTSCHTQSSQTDTRLEQQHKKNKFVRPRWPYDMRPSAPAEKYIRDAGPQAKTEVFLFWMFARKTVLL